MKHPFVEKQNVPLLSEELAEQLLQNVLEAEALPPSSIPLSVLISYSNYRKERFAFQRWILLLILILFCLLPLLFVYPKFQISLESDADAYPPIYGFALETSFPLKSVAASLNGEEIPISQEEAQHFTLEPTDNGTLLVTAQLKNYQYHQETLEIDTVDTKSPVYQSSSQDGDHFYLYVSDALSGVDYASVTATDTNGNSVLLDSYDEQEGCLVFLYPEQTLDVYVPDYAGNTLHLILNVG